MGKELWSETDLNSPNLLLSSVNFYETVSSLKTTDHITCLSVSLHRCWPTICHGFSEHVLPSAMLWHVPAVYVHSLCPPGAHTVLHRDGIWWSERQNRGFMLPWDQRRLIHRSDITPTAEGKGRDDSWNQRTQKVRKEEEPFWQNEESMWEEEAWYVWRPDSQGKESKWGGRGWKTEKAQVPQGLAGQGKGKGVIPDARGSCRWVWVSHRQALC